MRQVLALMGMVVLFAFSAGAAFAGEITGNGKYIAGSDSAPLHGNSPCAYSGQEDLQFVEGNGKGVPGHAQSWGQIVRQSGGVAGIGGAGPNGCNPHLGSDE